MGEAELIKERVNKIKELRKLGINPYPYKFDKTHNTDEIHSKYSAIKTEEEVKINVSLAGRIMLLRDMGKASFFDIHDERGKIQCYIREDAVKEDYKVFKLCDLGDFVGVGGYVFKTKKGELSIWVKKFSLLTKAIRPLPEKWHGLKDTEARYRKRYLDLIVNPEVKNVFVKRQKIINAMREFLNKKGFLEVDTPILQPIYGGANARPFKTMLNELKMPVYLRISNELYLKKLIVGGFEKIYEFAKDFRNEGIDRTHNPEFLQIEIYQAYADYNDIMELVEDIFAECCKAVNGNTKIRYMGNLIDFKKPWKRMTMKEAIKKYANIDFEKENPEGLKTILRNYNIEYEGELTKGLAMQRIFEELVEDKLIQPHFITQHPKETTPLCKRDRNDSEYVERFEPFAGGFEIANGYSELNDPVLQRNLLEEQANLLSAGNEEAHPMDEDFVQAIEVGMPPTGGVGIGIDRMCMLLLGQDSIKDVILFPFMKKK